MPTQIEKDSVTGTQTTGHVWDGIRELDTPMPKWWVYLFLACIVWAAGYCLLYPSVPYGPGYFPGLLGFSSRDRVNAQVATEAGLRSGAMDRIATLPYADILKDPKLAQVAQVAGRGAFANNCQACHAAGGAGRVGYPALAAGAWIWGGSLEAIETTLKHGIRSTDPDTRASQMPRFGADGVLTAAQIEQVADFVSTGFYGHRPAAAIAPASLAAGAVIYAENCAACHGERGEGQRAVGAPMLASKVHLYGDSRDAIVAQVRNPRQGMMPAWQTRLDPATLRSVVLYVHSLGGGE